MKPNEQLEKLVDSLGIYGTIEELANICREKAAHLRENWQDEKSAKVWDKDARLLEKALSKVNANV